MQNALTASAVLPNHPQHAGVVDLRGRLHACPVDERTAWLSLQELLESALQSHAFELHFDKDPHCVRYRIRSVVGANEYQLKHDSALSQALTLLDKQLLPEKSGQLSHRAWFLIEIAHQDMLFQCDHVQTSAGSGMSLRPLYDLKSPLPQLEQLLTLPGQAQLVRKIIQHKQGLVLLADTDRTQRVRTARSIAQCLTGPDQRILLSETSCHPLVPGVTQIAVPMHAKQEQQLAWRQACDMSYDVVIALETDHDAPILAKQTYQNALVVQGVCANTPSLALTQLIACGIRPESIARSLHSIVTQHKVALACEHCKCPSSPDSSIEPWINAQSPVKAGGISDWLADRLSDNFVEALGCEKCHDTGVGSVTTFTDNTHISSDVQDALFDSDVRYATDSLESHHSFTSKIIALARQGVISYSHAALHLTK